MNIRKDVHAGSWYESNKLILENQINNFLNSSEVT